ncbi:hypothetical protein V493_03304 [Pseudogymnoascus sp. VKM F-4281 (FW-2241)]|nr:hypothetical protein V493_03304 [Pseudogymnoascus sp. VKM F-4281 (FW-2241)]
MAPPRRSRRDPRKVQTRLSFEPRTNSSPSHAPSGISPARIVYQDPRNPKKKQSSLGAHKNEPGSSATGNEPNSSARSIPYFSDSDEIFADGRKFAVVLPSPSRSAAMGQPRGRSFMGAASSSVKQKGRPRKNLAYVTDSESEEETSAPMENTKKTPIVLEDGDESEEEETTSPVEKLKEPAADRSESSGEGEVATPADKRRKRPAFLKSCSNSPLKSPERAIVKDGAVETPRKRKADSISANKMKATPIRSFIAGGYLDPSPTQRSAKNQRDPVKNDIVKNDKPVSRKSKGKEIVAISSDDDSDSDAIVVEQPPIRKTKADSGRKEKALPSRKRRRSTSSEEDDEPVRSSPTKRRKQVLHEETSDEESDSKPAVPARRLAATPRKGQQTLNTKSSETKKDKEESTRQTRQTNTPKKHRTEKQKNLELLKRRRAGEKIDELTESSSDYEEEKGAYDSDASHAALSVFDDEDSEEAGIEQIRKSLRPANRNMDDDSFIVSDDDGPLGAPIHSLNEIPLEFTHHAHKHLKEHFKDAIEWMVQKKINPGFNHRDPIYIQAFRKLEPEARGLAHSKFSSSAWTEGFTRALWSRPHFHEEDISAGGEGEGRKCDACGRSNHPAKFRIQLLGKPYHQETLEDVEDSDSEDEDDDAASVNSKGQEILSADTDFYLGRFCRANAERAHALIHWKHALYEWVVQTLSEQGFLDGEKLGERIKWGQRRLGAFANEIVDEWTARGEIKGLYRDFKNNLEAARNVKQDRWNA